MRVLLVSQYFRPQPLANAESIGAIAFGLAELGHHVDVITPVGGADRTDRLTPRRAFGWFPTNRASKILRLLEYLTFSLGALLRAPFVPRPDVVLVPSPPPTLGLIGLVIAKLKRVPLVYNVQDLYPEVAVATGAVKPGLFLSLLGRLMKTVYRSSAAVVMIDPVLVDPLQASCPDATVVAIRNGIDLEPFAHAARSTSFLQEIGVPPDAAVVMYAGNVGRSQDLHRVIQAVEAAGAHLVIHGGGAALDELRAETGARGSGHVHFSGYRDRSMLGTVFASADVHVVPLKADVASASVPSKLLSIFAAGRPAIVTAEEGTAAAVVLAEAGGGWLVPPGEDGSLLDTIARALADPVDRERRGRLAREWALVNAGADRCAREYERLLLQVTQAEPDSTSR
jgi:colanic acid biosynthesis glycosyl transferase WcaI